MLVFLALLAAITFASMRFSQDNSAQALSVDQTQSIKGIFVVTIFFSHFCPYVILNQWYDTPMQEYCRWLGQLMVAPFLFYSGYGIFESVKKKGIAYVKGFPTKRILKILLHFDLAVILFLLYDFFLAPEYLSAPKILLSLLAWESVGNSNWFIFAILCAYLFGYVGLLAFKGNLSRAAILITVLCIIYIVVVSKFKERYWIDTILAFPLGCLVSLFKDKLSFKKHMLWFVAIAVCVLLLVAAKNGLIPTFYGRTQSALFAFSAALVLLSMRVKINSKVLSWFGSQVFGIYILQRLPMNFGKHLHWNEQNIYLYFLFCLAVTLLLAIAFNKATSWLDSKLFKKP